MNFCDNCENLHRCTDDGECDCECHGGATVKLGNNVYENNIIVIEKLNLSTKMSIWYKTGSQDIRDLIEAYTDLEKCYNKLKEALTDITKYHCGCGSFDEPQECCEGRDWIYRAEKALKEDSK